MRRLSGGTDVHRSGSRLTAPDPAPGGRPPVGPAPAQACADSTAVAAFALRVPPAELAALVWDGDLDPCPPPSWAGLAPDARCRARVLCFARGDFAATLQVERTGRPGVRGQVAPAVPAGMQLQRLRGEPVDLWSDDAGRFWLSWVPAGPVRLLVRGPERPCVATSWVLLD